MKNVNFLNNKFKKIEDEELKEKKKREQNLNLKRKLLKDEFANIDELEKHTQKQKQLIFQFKGSTEVEFKNELDKQIEYRNSSQKQLEQLQRQLSTLQSEQKQKGSEFEQNFSSGQFNQFATKSNYSAKQFSTIFSKSYYRSNTFQTLSHSKINNQQDIIEHLERLKQDIETAESNIINEDERTLSIKNQVEQLFKTKQKFKQELGELESLNEAADKRFDNLQRIQFLAQEKQKTTFKQLSKIKQELQEQDTIRQGILSKQEEQREKEHQGRKQNEEITGNIMIKIDELQKQYDEAKQELQTILVQEKKIIKKRMQSKYILKYIDFFETFREIFCGEEVTQINLHNIRQIQNVEEDRIKQLYDAQDGQSFNEIQHIDEIIKEKNIEADARSNQSIYSSNMTPRGQSDSYISHSRSASSPMRSSNKDQIKEADQKTDENQIQSDEEIERTELINKINRFLDLYPTGLEVCIENVLRLFNEMRYQQETNNEKYEQLLKAKTQKTQDLIIFENKFDELKKNNPYVEIMRQNSTEEQKIENIWEAFDAGYVKVSLPKYPLISANKDGEELANKLSLFTTVNIMKLFDMTDFQPIIEEIKYNKNFFFNFFMNYGDSIIRICKIVKTIFKKILQNIPSIEMNKRCSDTIKYINSIWQDNENNREIIESNINLPDQTETKQNTTESNKQQNNNLLNLPLLQFGNSNAMSSPMSAFTPQLRTPISFGNQVSSFQPNRHRSRVSIDTGGIEQLEQIQEQFDRKQKKRKIIVEKFNNEEINNLFQAIFGDGFEKQANEFFEEIKNDRLVWFFCNPDVIQEYLIQKYNQNNNDAKLAVEDALLNFIQVEEYASQEYNHRLNDLYNHFTGLMNQIKLENNEILEDLQSKNIIYRPNRLFKSNELQNNPKITQAIENAIKRRNEYLFSLSDNNPVKEDQYANIAINPTSNLHQLSTLNGSLLNNRTSSGDQKIIGNGSQGQINNSRLQQIVDYIENVPSTRQREAAKRKYISTPQLHYSVSSKSLTGAHNSSGFNFGNGSTQNPSQNQRGSFSISKDFATFVQFQQNANTQSQQILQQQNQSQQNLNLNSNQISSQSQQLASPGSQQQVNIGQNSQNSQSAIGVELQQQRLAAISGGILKKKVQPRKTLNYKSLQDIYEDNHIEQEAKKQKEREKQEYLEYQQKEKEINQKLLQIQKEKPNAHVKIIKNLDQRLTLTSDSRSNRNKTLKQFSQNQKILSKIDRLDRNYDPSQTANSVFNGILQEKKNIYKSMIQQEQDERLGSDSEKNSYNQINVFNEDDDLSQFKQTTLKKSQSDYLRIKTTNANELRKKANTQQMKQSENENSQNQNFLNENLDKAISIPQSQKQKQRDKTRSNEKNPSTVKSWRTGGSTGLRSKRPDTQQNSSSQDMHNQFYLSQNQKFFQKYENMSNEKMPNINENRSQEKRIPQSSKSSNSNAMKKLKYQLGNQHNNYSKNKTNNKSDQLINKIKSQTSENKLNNQFRLGDFDRSNFYDFPFFSHPLSVANCSHTIPIYPFLQPPTLNLYTPTGLLTNFGKNDNINIQNSQSYY